jgi:murein L,D-transpeptidase YcbB/YkuD
LRSDAEWTSDRIHKAMLSGSEQHVKLTNPRQVEIVYFTAWVDADGVLQFRDDVYGHDATLRGELFAKSEAR